jgi:hypothetical protein
VRARWRPPVRRVAAGRSLAARRLHCTSAKTRCRRLLEANPECRPRCLGGREPTRLRTHPSTPRCCSAAAVLRAARDAAELRGPAPSREAHRSNFQRSPPRLHCIAQDGSKSKMRMRPSDADHAPILARPKLERAQRLPFQPASRLAAATFCSCHSNRLVPATARAYSTVHTHTPVLFSAAPIARQAGVCLASRASSSVSAGALNKSPRLQHRRSTPWMRQRYGCATSMGECLPVSPPITSIDEAADRRVVSWRRRLAASLGKELHAPAH